MFFGIPLLMALAMPNAQGLPPIENSGFESASQNPGQIPGWKISGSESGARVETDEAQFKEGSRSLLIETRQQAGARVSQEVFLPVGTTWKVSVWVKGEASAEAGSEGPFRPAQPPAEYEGYEGWAGAGGALEIDTRAGSRGNVILPSGTFSWQREEVVFRVPPPGRVSIALLSHSAGKLWFDDVRLEPVTVAQEADVRIVNSKITRRPIDLKQGGLFIEPQCHMLPSLLAQQVEGGSFEEETPCTGFRLEVDWPYRPWYPDGAVHDATFTLDTTDAYDGKRSEKIELPMARSQAGISQDGYYLKQGVGYRLHLHMKGEGHVRVWASLRGGGRLIAGPMLIGRAEDKWRAAEVLLRANSTISNATLTIEFEGPGALSLDRIYLIGDDAVLGLWRPDVVQALKAVNPGFIRFGGSVIESGFEWEKTIGPWDQRTPYVTPGWGGIDPNFVGIEEFVELTRYVGAEPLICIRWTGRTPEDAANEVEYMNGSADTHWGRIRAQNGHPEPYGVKYWQIGNEVRGSQYDASVGAFAQAMHKVDPSIKIMSALPSADTLREGGGYLDYLCPHHYEIANLPREAASFDFMKDQAAQYGAGKDVRVAVTEWNTTGGAFGLGRGMLLALGNALSVARYRNLMHRDADVVEIAARKMADSFGSGMIQPLLDSLYLSPTYYAQQLYQEAAGTYPLEISQSPNIPWQLREPDLSATLSPDGKVLRIFAVNSTAEPEKVQFHLDGFSPGAAGGELAVLKDKENARDSEAMNSRNDPQRITTTSHAIDLKGREFAVSFEPFSVTMLALRLGHAQGGK